MREEERGDERIKHIENLYRGATWRVSTGQAERVPHTHRQGAFGSRKSRREKVFLDRVGTRGAS